ncbi:adenine nucleotide translocase lysine N-methyltransferase-like [Alosa sapidissima]|uniref:adenine nucleotide translocase lysine N-methyltransferase-like n=1 Tax=Alosa sapidissima TaxID=34773 RepID=UPI001C09B68A|nr:adenine nucleotide translocase lysine N-methyltransferase-like [Alosa sapidissima]XP_041915734.1 adenine nucleotide translocase lysine N-methyltransferase-like [Alosa sapidissima]
MEDNIEVLLQDHTPRFRNSSHLTLAIGTVFTGVYGIWAMFVLPGFRRVPIRLKVPFMPSPEQQTQNVLKLLKGRRGQLADLGSGDGRLVLGAHTMGFQCTGYEINPMLLAYSRARVWWRGIPSTHIRFLNQDFWKTDMSKYQNVTVFLAPAVMEQLEQKLRAELPPNARVVVCCFPFPNWLPSCAQGAGLEQVWAYDMPPRSE